MRLSLWKLESEQVLRQNAGNIRILCFAFVQAKWKSLPGNCIGRDKVRVFGDLERFAIVGFRSAKVWSERPGLAHAAASAAIESETSKLTLRACTIHSNSCYTSGKQSGDKTCVKRFGHENPGYPNPNILFRLLTVQILLVSVLLNYLTVGGQNAI